MVKDNRGKGVAVMEELPREGPEEHEDPQDLQTDPCETHDFNKGS